ncbi:hypothetical protein B9Z55_016468 [Caenorhabditis nigoni]|uniref:F-box domain-containing protein n=1 Tax=Caenorhabditis nigoni TaxID=1611254 RepID=A0A2G5T585_9PELO|nr:hypothetical protein B9Z55_016468 [Caenorhabditis nigoni]
MPIHLFKLPILVRFSVVTELEYQEIFLLSLCSRRTTFLVEKAGIRAPKLTFQLEERNGYNRFKIGIMDNFILLPIIRLKHVTELKSKGTFTVKFGLEYEADTSLQLRCKMYCMQDGSFQHIIDCAHEPVVVQKAFQKHINSIFHYSDTYHLILSMKCKGPLPNITNVSKIQIEDETVDPQFLTNVLTRIPLNLHKLPRLVRLLIVTESDYQDLFLLSLCSHRTTFLIEKAGIKAPKLIFQLQERHGHDQFKIGLSGYSLRYGWILLPIIRLMHVTKLKSKRKFNVKFGLDDEGDTNLQLRCRMVCMPDGSIQHRIDCANDPMVVQKAFQKHINSIFHYSDGYQLITSMKCKRPLPHISNVSKIQIEDETDTVDPQFLKNLLTTYPDSHTLSVVPDIMGELPKDSPFFQVQDIFVQSQCGPDYFHNFVGRNMELHNVAFTEQDVIQFLQKWISNEAYHNLETLSLWTRYATNGGNPINGDMIRQAIEFERYDPNEPEKRPAQYVVESCPYVGSIPGKYDLDERFVEIKRITDGKRAFLYADGVHVKLFVLKSSLNEINSSLINCSII